MGQINGKNTCGKWAGTIKLVYNDELIKLLYLQNLLTVTSPD